MSVCICCSSLMRSAYCVCKLVNSWRTRWFSCCELFAFSNSLSAFHIKIEESLKMERTDHLHVISKKSSEIDTTWNKFCAASNFDVVFPRMIFFISSLEICPPVLPVTNLHISYCKQDNLYFCLMFNIRLLSLMSLRVCSFYLFSVLINPMITLHLKSFQVLLTFFLFRAHVSESYSAVGQICIVIVSTAQ